MQRLIRWLEWRRYVCFELLRIYLGIGLFVKGIQFASDPTLVTRLLTRNGHVDPLVALVTHFVVPAHIGGGLMLVAGLLTRTAALLNLPVLVGAVLFVHELEGLLGSQDSQFSLLVLFALALVVVHGGGRWSVDWHVFEQPRLQARAQAAALALPVAAVEKAQEVTV